MNPKRFRFTRAEHIQLIKLYYQIITSDELGTVFVNHVCLVFEGHYDF